MRPGTVPGLHRWLKRPRSRTIYWAMLRASSIRLCLLRLARNESGIALPTAMLATVAALALAGAAVTSTVNVQQSSHRDSDSKSAIGVADAGANVALLRLGRDSGELAENSCLSGSSPEGNGWCSPVTGEVGGGEYSYQLSEAGIACGESSGLCVVSTGIAGGVTRRVEVTFTQSSGSGSGEGGGEGGPEGLIGDGDIDIEENADVRVSVGTNGRVYVHNNGNVCGNIRHGVGEPPTDFYDNGTQCSGYTETEENVDLPSVASFMPSDIAENNSNYRLVNCVSENSPEGCEEDTYSGKWKSNVPWNPETRTISTFNNASLTLGGGDYFICKLELSNNSHLIMAKDALVRIFFDTPENCGLSNGEKQIYISNNANITSTGYQPGEEKYSVPGLYVQGSTSIETTVEWKNNSGTNELFLYAPNSHIELQNNAVFVGTVAGKTIHVANNVVIRQDDGFDLPDDQDPWPENEGPPVYTAQYYVECSGEPTPTPDAGC